jgi:anti-anti-sigma regulatory factor
MVRISENGTSGRHRVVRLEGKVVGSCVAQVESYCQGILSQGHTLAIDMAEVSFLDRSGVDLFIRLMKQRVDLLNCSPFVSELLKPVTL